MSQFRQKSDSYPIRDYSGASAPGSDLPSMAAIRAPVEERDEKLNAGDDHGGERDIQLVQARNPRPSPDVGTGADYQLTVFEDRARYTGSVCFAAALGDGLAR